MASQPACPAVKFPSAAADVARPRPACCSAAPAPKKEAVVAGVAAAAAAALSHPLAAEAAATPSLNNLIGSLVAGGVVLAGIAFAVSTVS